jgi:hypothetical protein
MHKGQATESAHADPDQEVLAVQIHAPMSHADAITAIKAGQASASS